MKIEIFTMVSRLRASPRHGGIRGFIYDINTHLPLGGAGKVQSLPVKKMD
jgi:hypothetical protein